MKPKVIVLLSAYNGEKYIREQINSIITQEWVDIKILVRDDGSTDATRGIIEELRQKYPEKIDLLMGDNVGAAYSFLKLINEAVDRYIYADFFCFSDQDDYWKTDKLANAVRMMKNHKREDCALYVSNLIVSDANLNMIIKTKEQPFCIEEMMLRNNFAGCTMVFNRTLACKVTEYHPQYLEMHDSWIIRLNNCLGGTLYVDDESYILYRQHDNNVVGSTRGIINNIKRKIEQRNVTNVSSRTARELYLGYEQSLTDAAKHLLIALMTKNKRELMHIYKPYQFSYFHRYIFFVFDVLTGRI